MTSVPRSPRTSSTHFRVCAKDLVSVLGVVSRVFWGPEEIPKMKEAEETKARGHVLDIS